MTKRLHPTDEEDIRMAIEDGDTVSAGHLQAAMDEIDFLRDIQMRTRDALTVALGRINDHFETLHRLAMNYPEVHHILSTPRKHSAVVVLEHVIHRLENVAANGD